MGVLFLAMTVLTLGVQAPSQKQNSGLRVTEVFFLDFKGAPTPRWAMKPGEEVALDFRIDGFGREEAVNKEGLREQRIHLTYQVELHDPQGYLVEPAKSGEIITTLTPQDAEWRPKINWSAKVPPAAPGGNYAVLIHVSDLIAKRETDKTVSFRVLGQGVSASDALRISEVEYSNSERGPWNPERYFAPSETIWVRYRITGFRVSPEKQVWVEQDWAVLDESGNEIVSQPNAAVTNEASYYPPRFVSTNFTLALKNPKPGKYTLRIVAHDRISGESTTVDSDFFLRP
ncbi:MAG: hypothetical protein HYX72_13980 [Acidobacteria bacterium]|nr:hypothetical protein [Acidobacteriota bacterium]